MKIQVNITRQENADYFGAAVGDTVEVELEDYVAAVTASELASGGTEGCRAQAVAARTFAVNHGVLKGKTISDSSSTAQAYRASRNDPAKYPTAVQAAKDTAGEILTYNGSAISAVYSAGNGGRTVSSKERWGGDRPYLIAQDDPWDAAAGGGRTGHGVGMSQRGARYAASHGRTYREILAFYYPGTQIETINKGGGRMISAADFVEKVKIPLAEKWGYIYGTHGVIWTAEKQAAATKEQTVNYGKQWIGRMVTDCSGLIYWACMQLGEKVVHHATYLYTDWSRPKGKLVNIPVNAAGETKGRDDGQPIKPGTLVFIKGKEEKIHHTGVYIGDNTVIEAKGTKSGVTTSQLSHWEYWGELKVLDYTGAKTPESGEKPMSRTMRAVVNNPHNKLNVRKEPSQAAAKVCQVLKGTIVDVVEQTNDEWWKISYNGKTGYTMAKYLQLQEPAEKPVAEEPVIEWPAEVEPVAAEPVAEEPQKKESLLDKIRGIFGGRKEEQSEEVPEELPEDEEAEDAPFDKVVGPETVQAQLVGIAGDLDILTRLVNDAKATLNPEELVEILNALDKVLPEIQQAKDDMWTMITVG